MYRDTWCLGAGKCTIQNFLTILSERGLLIRLQNFKTAHAKQLLRSDKQYISTGKKDIYGVVLNEILDTFYNSKKDVKSM
jgi:hypothetical protein